MKWGVRKYQNEDGSLTEAGKERYRNKEKPVPFAVYDKNGNRVSPERGPTPTYRKRVERREINPVSVYDKNGNRISDPYYDVLTGYGRQAIKPSNDINGTSAFMKGWETNMYGYDGMPTSAREANYAAEERRAKEREEKYDKMRAAASMMGKGSIPTSALTAKKNAENEKRMKANIPASAWNQRISSLRK